MTGPCVFCNASLFVEDYADVLACESCMEERSIKDGLELLQHLDDLEDKGAGA